MGFFFAFADDMDINDCPLMGAHGYCSQEMVHLFLLGKAISNTFDGDKILDEATILKGIHKRSDIGSNGSYLTFQFQNTLPKNGGKIVKI